MDAIVKQALAHRSRRTATALGAALLGSGCELRHYPILDPKGPIALAERDLLFTAVVLMLIVVIPVFVMAFLFAFRTDLAAMPATPPTGAIPSASMPSSGWCRR